MDPKKIEAIIDSTKVYQLRSFLGLTNYYKNFIARYAKIVAFLTNLLKKNENWDWIKKCVKAFKGLKGVISFELVLKLPNFEMPFEMPFEVHTNF